MASKNDITGDTIATRTITDTYRNNYDLIFGKKKRGTTDNSIREIQSTADQENDQSSDERQRVRTTQNQT